ncbi:butyryl-CoA dehydrogenase [Tamaricihabitans halophyticus]|uniref:Butyryl-CoA dehydrogenase n=1 Tax=Tamaricihabitans halophyticus TaxID=1262583 RepID=A0A4R2QAD8_9PSEU|nr:acyl-CoA dehydrogenase family protein [Tamaricihabitans halophyticus]TCP45048.1 butyryl-CoA dehydrogenase [Tamaricihabitans halophyticus]
MFEELTAIPSALTDDQQALRNLAREFTEKEVLPVANELDPSGGQIPLELREKMAEVGFFGLRIPEEYGGLGLGATEYCIVAEELARGWMSVASILARGNGMMGSLSDEQKARWYPRMVRGELLGATAISEPEAGSDVANISCRAVRSGDDWVITGTKMWCTFADGADYITVFARTAEPSDPAKRHQGVSAFLFEKERGSFPDGVSGNRVRKIGYRGWDTWELSFDNARVPGDALIGAEGVAFKYAMQGLDLARAHTAARSIGLARAALEDSKKYMGERQVFGEPLNSFQYLRFKLAEMATEIEAARQLMYSVCRQIDAGQRASLGASMVKLFASEMAERATSYGLQIHGGAGYTTDFALERHWRDARLTKIFEGTSEIQMRIISDQILGR